LVDGDDARFGFGAYPTNVAVIEMLDFPAGDASVATIYRYGIPGDRVEAVERFGEVSSRIFELTKVVTRENIGMSDASALEGTLEELDGMGLTGKLFERHLREWFLLSGFRR
jgi:hypothetical protein